MVDGYCIIEHLGTLARARCCSCTFIAKVDHAEEDPSVGFSHMFPSGNAFWMNTYVDRHRWTSAEALGDLKRMKGESWASNKCER